MQDQNLEHYDSNAEVFSAQYRAAEPEALQKLLMRWLPSSGSVLEIGCGSGRDAVIMKGSCVLNIKASIRYNQPHVDECVQPYHRRFYDDAERENGCFYLMFKYDQAVTRRGDN